MAIDVLFVNCDAPSSGHLAIFCCSTTKTYSAEALQAVVVPNATVAGLTWCDYPWPPVSFTGGGVLEMYTSGSLDHRQPPQTCPWLLPLQAG